MKKSLLVIAAMMLFLAGCTPNIEPENYSTDQTGQASKTQSAVIVAATPVTVSGAGGGTQGVGTLAGAVAGGAGGSAIGGGARANIIGGVGGALIGGALGSLAEKKLTSQTGMQYQVALNGDRNNMITVTQGATPLLRPGQKVYVIYSNPVRVIPQ